jgi:hypothetical protein
MLKDERDVVEVLKSELEFLRNGNYSERGSWGPRFIFEDSPTCLNFGHRDNPSPCSGCILIDFVPPEHRSEKFPCRHISLDASGQTLDALYRHSGQEEVEATVSEWLQFTIQRLEKDRERHRQESERIPLAGPENRGIPLHEKLHPKCANPARPAAFHWLAGGKFFRFRPQEISSKGNQLQGSSPSGHQGVKHYWLCESCLRLFTLVYDREQGVVLKPRWLGLSIARSSGEGQ